MKVEVDPGEGISLLMGLNFNDIPDGHIGYVIQNPAANYETLPKPPYWEQCNYGPGPGGLGIEPGTYYAGHREIRIGVTDSWPGTGEYWFFVAKCHETQWECYTHVIVMRSLFHLPAGRSFSLVRREVEVGCDATEPSGTFSSPVCQRPYGPMPNEGFIVEPPVMSDPKTSAFISYWESPCP